MRAVEDGPCRARARRVVAPQEVVRGLLGRRLLVRVHAHALRIRPAEDVLDGGVLARGVDALQDDQHGIATPPRTGAPAARRSARSARRARLAPPPGSGRRSRRCRTVAGVVGDQRATGSSGMTGPTRDRTPSPARRRRVRRTRLVARRVAGLGGLLVAPVEVVVGAGDEDGGADEVAEEGEDPVVDRVPPGRGRRRPRRSRPAGRTCWRRRGRSPSPRRP